MQTAPLTAFILSFERPLYLWATLDNLLRTTKSKARFVLIDSGSQDPLVHKVIEGFSRRDFFHEVVKFPNNDIEWAESFFNRWHEKVGDMFFFIENDVVIEEQDTCWMQRMKIKMDNDPTLAMLGSKIDKSDFIDPERLEKRLLRKLTPEEAEQIKLNSPERTMADIGPNSIESPFNPPGRLLALRTKAVRSHLGNVMQFSDGKMHQKFINNGWKTGIYGGVVHRHLSLQNYFDYSEYSMELRKKYMQS